MENTGILLMQCLVDAVWKKEEEGYSLSNAWLMLYGEEENKTRVIAY